MYWYQNILNIAVRPVYPFRMVRICSWFRYGKDNGVYVSNIEL